MTLRLFIEVNGWTWLTYPPVDEAEDVVLAVAAGEWKEPEIVNWLKPRLQRTVSD